MYYDVGLCGIAPVIVCPITAAWGSFWAECRVLSRCLAHRWMDGWVGVSDVVVLYRTVGFAAATLMPSMCACISVAFFGRCRLDQAEHKQRSAESTHACSRTEHLWSVCVQRCA